MPHNKELLEEIDSIRHEVAKIYKSNQSWFQKVYEIAKLIVSSVEKVTSDVESAAKLSGPEKKEMALSLLEDVYFDRWQSKAIPDWIERKVLRLVAGKAIDRAVAYFNTIGVFKHSD